MNFLKQTKKNLFFVLLCIAALFPINSYAENQITTFDFGGGVTGRVENGTLIVEKTDPSGSGELVKKDWKLRESFSNAKGIENVIIKEGVISIAQSSFAKSKDAPITGTVTIADSVKKIDTFAFQGNKISVLNLGKNLEYIGHASFEKNNIETLVIPDSVKIIDSSAFHANPIKSLTLGKSLEYIGSSSFTYIDAKKITIPGTVKKIGDFAFAWSDVEDLDLQYGIERIGYDAFHMTGLKTVKIPGSVKSIGQSAFECNFLQKVIIGPNVNISNKSFGSRILGVHDLNTPNHGLYSFEKAYHSDIMTASSFYNITPDPSFSIWNDPNQDIVFVNDGVSPVWKNITENSKNEYTESNYFVNQNGKIKLIVKKDNLQIVYGYSNGKWIKEKTFKI